MTRPDVDIAAAVELARRAIEFERLTYAQDDSEARRIGLAYFDVADLARALLLLADERATVEQRTAERIAAWVERNGLMRTGDEQLAAMIRGQRWEERP